MNPTQAQIEAAQLLEELRNPCGIQTQYTAAMYNDAAEVIEKLLAALTAAAEIEPMASLADEKLINSPNARAAAAEVGDGSPTLEEDYKKAVEVIAELEDKIDEIKAATIERCAQVIKEWFDKADPANVGKDMPLPIALIAAIRALKDKP